VNQQRVLTVLGVVALVAIVGAVAAFATGGGDDPKVSVGGASTTSSSAVTAPIPSSTTVVSPSTLAGQPTPTTGICSLPEDASQAFVDGWLAGDRAAAERCGSPDAVNTMFQTSGAGAQYTFQGCDSTDPGVPTCSYTYPGGAARLTIEGTEAAGWKVTKVEYTAD
jgi:hypothetical protein